MRSGAEGPRGPVDLGFEPTEAERRTQVRILSLRLLGRGTGNFERLKFSVFFVIKRGYPMKVDEVIAEIIHCCRIYDAEKVILFGSRAKGTATERSDIDIAVSGVKSCDVLDLEEKLQDIPTLYTIDLVDLDTCRNQLLLEDIRQYGRGIYKKI